MSTRINNNTVVKIMRNEDCFTCQDSFCTSDDDEDVLIVLNSKNKSSLNSKNKSSLNSKNKSSLNLKSKSEKQDKKYDYEKIELEKLKDDIKEKTIIVEYLEKKLEKEKKKLEGLKYVLEELELLNIKEE